MCNFPGLTEHVVAAIAALTGDGDMFTGQDVARTIRTPSGYGPNGTAISADVRELFNSHHPCFKGWCCYPIPGGPLLYFPLEDTRGVRTRAKEIMKEIEANPLPGSMGELNNRLRAKVMAELEGSDRGG